MVMCSSGIYQETEESHSCQETIIYPLNFLSFLNDEQSDCLHNQEP